jgi:hypothetical protein
MVALDSCKSGRAVPLKLVLLVGVSTFRSYATQPTTLGLWPLVAIRQWVEINLMPLWLLEL